jgi:prolyl oligopeptidase
MTKKALLLFMVLAIALFSCKKNNLNYPDTRKSDVTDTYFGTEVPDPYRWLENDTAREVEQWVEAQNEVTYNYLEQIPYREKIAQRLKTLWNYERMGVPYQEGGRYFFFKNDGLQDQSILYMKETLDSEPEVVIDPNQLSEDGSVALMDFSVSHDGNYLAYAISRGGSDWREVYVMNLNNGKKLDDHLEWLKFSNIAWYENGFFYSRYDEPEEGEKLTKANKNHKVFYHQVGTAQSEDELVFNKPEHPQRNYSASVSSDQKYLYLYETRSTHGNNVYIKNLEKDDAFVKLTTGFQYEYNIIDHLGDQIVVHTNYQAPKYKVVVIDMQKRDVGNWIDLIPEQKNVLRSCEVANDRIIASYLKDASSRLKVFDMQGNSLYEIELPSLGTVGSLSASAKSDQLFYSFSSFTVPTQIWHHDLKSRESSLYFKPSTDFNPDEYVTRQVFYRSKDQTKVPMFLVHKKGLSQDKKHPVFLYGYGGFNISMTPGFSQSNMVWLENGGIYAMANLRGGGEYGEKWHKQGMKLNKQNVFDDFIGAAQYLVEEGYTTKDQIAIHGGSNGGLLVGAVVNQRPDLFEVAIPAVGVMDMLRYHKFTIGWAWADEYGTSQDSLHFRNLLDYSPLHNIEEGKDYPAIMAMTADHDDRVVPAHSFKYIATLQEKYDGPNPTLIRIQTKAGHGAGKSTSARIQEKADIWSFVFKNIEAIQPRY